MVALIVVLGLFAQSFGPSSSLQLISATMASGEYAQVSACPPCLDRVPPGARVIGTASAPPDASGLVESIVAYYVRDPSFSSLEVGRLSALAVRASAGTVQVYKLDEALEQTPFATLGETPYADLVARDLNGDGLTELAVTGGVGAHSTLLHIFRWNGSGYGLLEQFFGDSGVRLIDLDGDGSDEVIVGVRHYDRAQLRSETVMRWNGSTYVPAYSRWGFVFEDPAFQDYPEAVVLKYYRAIAARDFRTAYSLLGPSMQAGQSQVSFEQGFATTQDVRVEDLEVLNEAPTSALVRVELSSLERDGTVNRYSGTWILERLAGAWRLTGAYITAV